MLWTAGSITEKRRGSLASLPPEGVSASNGRWIKDGWIGLDRREGEETGSPGKTTKTAAAIAGGDRARRSSQFGRNSAPNHTGPVRIEIESRGELT